MGYEPLTEYHDTNNNWTVEGFTQFNVMKNMMQPLAEAAVPAGQTPANATYSYLGLDHLSSTRAVFNQVRTQTASLEFYPYGEQLSSTGVLPYHQFTAKSFDSDVDAYYFPFRYYYPNMSRWISSDPYGIINGPNTYVYVGESPIIRYDPLGLCYPPFCYWDPTNGDDDIDFAVAATIFCTKGACIAGAKSWFILQEQGQSTVCSIWEHICAQLPKDMRKECRKLKDKVCQDWLDWIRDIYDKWMDWCMSF